MASAVSTGARQRSSEGTTTAISSERGACVRQLPDLLRDELERAPAARPLEEAERALELGTGRRLVGEEVPLDVRECRVAVLGRPWRQLLDPAAGERAEVLDRPL